jgi:tRNA-guanine family transglycosylase
MIFDECTPYPADKATADQSMQLSLRWAQRSKDTHQALGNENALFGIVQGGMYEDLRQQSAKKLISNLVRTTPFWNILHQMNSKCFYYVIDREAFATCISLH